MFIHTYIIFETMYYTCADGDYSTSVPLSHDVAKHRMAIRPKRKHGNPRSKKPVSVNDL